VLLRGMSFISSILTKMLAQYFEGRNESPILAGNMRVESLAEKIKKLDRQYLPFR
jgi:hypothetical protein